MQYFQPGTLVITPGDREDVILAALSTSTLSDAEDRAIAGLVLSGDLLPHQSVLDLIGNSDVPVIKSPLDSYAVASGIHSMTVKTLPGDVEKIDKIQALIDRHVDVDRLLEKLA
jgi:BioD-like phosphotransacetylase family protein